MSEPTSTQFSGKYKKELRIATALLVIGYLSLLAFLHVAFNNYDSMVLEQTPHRISAPQQHDTNEKIRPRL